MCDKCKNEVSSKNKCRRCGTVMDKGDNSKFINPNFDANRFEELKKNSR